MLTSAYTLFDTDIGRCGIAWNAHGISGVQLPERTPSETEARLRRHCNAMPLEPTPAMQRIIEDIVALLSGQQRDLMNATLDMRTLPPFHRQVYEVARSISPGQTATYGEIATRLGMPGAARAVGHALGRNPFPIIVPCHRVLAAGGHLGGFSASGGLGTKQRLLAIEGAKGLTVRDLFDGETSRLPPG
ncbi:MAG: methylated-DNA--[protein]-cysteine S-methyltransferase [Nevskiaceae bacterium]|nr:MAG: methylated-DNA--[protein]-cysteine S-methyltransferase [Nevskiaceae bacterium]